MLAIPALCTHRSGTPHADDVERGSHNLGRGQAVEFDPETVEKLLTG